MMMIIIQFNSIQFFIINVPSQQLQGQLQTQHSVGTIIIIIIIIHVYLRANTTARKPITELARANKTKFTY
jgi:hypothetical protein